MKKYTRWAEPVLLDAADSARDWARDVQHSEVQQQSMSALQTEVAALKNEVQLLSTLLHEQADSSAPPS